MFNSFARVRYARVFVRAHEGVGILVLVQITKRVVDLSMLRLVCSDIEEKVFHSPLSLGYAPVVCCEIRDHELRVCPLWEFPGVDILNSERVREHGLFLEVADEAVAGARRDEVREEHAIEEDTLSTEDHEFHKPAGLSHLEEREEVHTFVVRLFQQRFDPAVVSLHPPEAMQVPKHTGDHAWDTGYRFEEYKSD